MYNGAAGPARKDRGGGWIGLADGARPDAIPNAAGGEGRHGVATRGNANPMRTMFRFGAVRHLEPGSVNLPIRKRLTNANHLQL